MSLSSATYSAFTILKQILTHLSMETTDVKTVDKFILSYANLITKEMVWLVLLTLSGNAINGVLKTI